MKEAIRDCTAISYFDRYPVIRSFGYNNEEETRSRGQKRRVRRDGEGGGGEKRREKNIYIYMTALSVWYLARDLIYIFFFSFILCYNAGVLAAADSAHYSASYERHADNEKHGPTRGSSVSPPFAMKRANSDAFAFAITHVTLTDAQLSPFKNDC